MSSVTENRAQILANAAFMLKPASSTTPNHVVIFGQPGAFTAAIMVGLTPAIEGAEGGTPEAAMRFLLITTCEMLQGYVPKVGAHQRNVHGGGVFDEDMISGEMKKCA